MAASQKVSIVTCFLNVERYIEETIQSVLQQHHTNWELLLVDDGAADKSTSIAKHYAATYPDKIFYFEHDNHQNKGASFSRNVAIEKSTGEYIAFLDADDTWLPNYLTSQLAILSQYPVAMVCQATEYWSSWRKKNYSDVTKPVGTTQDKSFSPPSLLLDLYPLGRGAAPCICGTLVKKEAIVKLCGFANDFKGMYDDQTLLVKLYLHEPVYISSVVQNRYRQRPESLVHTSHQTGNYKQERRIFLEWLKVYLKSQPVQYPEVDKLLRIALLPYHSPVLYYLTKKAPQKAKKWIARVLPGTIKQYIKQQQKAL
ncbi:glycosyltransferase family 2 protein [Pontibacter fetidus]|uniref:Glycosyltransferase family 2 protein n=1 Tax=Pontibacter fetidus TaxID=2700082 RepID=A0A6B2H636_9BACT|nr:glycosyltransferase family 2 protein [Pontibacter fetidus]NDK54534.1 glycosyltransferase family 2 protein [Pontibacter fetidus]